MNNILNEKHKDVLGNPDFEQDFYSITALVIYKIRQDFIRLMRWLAYYDPPFYEKIKYSDLMGSIYK